MELTEHISLGNKDNLKKIYENFNYKPKGYKVSFQKEGMCGFAYNNARIYFTQKRNGGFYVELFKVSEFFFKVVTPEHHYEEAKKVAEGIEKSSLKDNSNVELCKVS